MSWAPVVFECLSNWRSAEFAWVEPSLTQNMRMRVFASLGEIISFQKGLALLRFVDNPNVEGKDLSGSDWLH